MWRRENGDGAREPRELDAGVRAAGDNGEGALALAVPRARPRLGATAEAAYGRPWVIVLAGGDGRRLEAVTRSPDGVAVPKQFCRFRDDRSLLRATLDRARRVADRERVVVVVTEHHRSWWEPELGALPAENVLVQPENRGTAVGILHALVHIRQRDRSPMLLVMPSDHDVDNEDVLLGRARRALRTAAVFEDELVLLGIVPAHIDVEYGLIVPTGAAHGDSRRVMTFVEKPAASTAALLMSRGALWNSFIFACTGGALHGLYEDAVPALLRTYVEGVAAAGGDVGTAFLRFRGLPMCDFSRDLLQPETRRLRIIPVPPCGWTDLGTPVRLAAWLDRHREAAFWQDRRLRPAFEAMNHSGAWRARTA